MTNIEESPEQQQQRSLPKSTLRKFLLLIWLVVIIQIYYSPDTSGSSDDDLTFAVPQREVAAMVQGIYNIINEDNVNGTLHKQNISVDIDSEDNTMHVHESIDKEIGNGTLHNKDNTTIGLSTHDNTMNQSIVATNNSTPELEVVKHSNTTNKNITIGTNEVKTKWIEDNLLSIAAKHKISVDKAHDDNNSTSIVDIIDPTTNKSIIEALQPITYKQCCIPAIFKGTNKGLQDVPCFGACFNERACNDSSFPYDSMEQKAQFPLAQLTPDDSKKLKKMCKFPDVSLTPPTEWCQKPHKPSNESAWAQLIHGIPPAGCSTNSNAGGSGAFQHVILFPKHKLAFCGIPKVGITQWEQFLRFYIGAKDYPSLPHYKMDRELFQFDKMSPEVQRRIWEDEEWTWAAFIRNPAERLLSGYLDKVVKTKKGKKKQSALFNKLMMMGDMSFDNFVANISKPLESNDCRLASVDRTGLSWCSDPHWRPQVYSCGMSERLDRFDFIGTLDEVADQTRELLTHVGMWESHGKKFINGGQQILRSPWCGIGSHPHNHTVNVGFQQKDESSNRTALVYEHAKNSKEKLDSFYSPELLKKVQEELFADDYKLWKLVHDNGNKLSRGKDLMSKLSSKCDKA